MSPIPAFDTAVSSVSCASSLSSASSLAVPPSAENALEATAALEETEAYRVLLSRANRRTGPIPAPLLVKHVLAVTRGADWPVQREAMEALLRRLSFARKDGLRIATRPPGRLVLGPYTTRRRGTSARPYRTVLESIDPPRGSCDCPDFLRSSLGLCKHLLVVMEDVAAKPRRFGKALREGADASPGAGLRWRPVRPLTGRADPLEQVVWLDGKRKTGRDGERTIAGRWFRSGSNGELVLKDPCTQDTARRLGLVNDLLHLTRRQKQRRRKGSTDDPALEALLDLERRRLGHAVRAGLDRPALTAALRGLKQRLYPFQRVGVERFLAAGRLLLADDMGLGKTAQAIACCTVLWKHRKVKRGLLLVPASLKPQWLREWQLFSDAPVDVVEGFPADRAAKFRSSKRGFLIANYEQLLRDLELVHRWKPDIVVLDEAQRIKNWATKTAAYVKTLTPPYRLVLTGTPMENRIDELASILDWVDDFALEPKWRLVPWHTTPVDGRREIGGARNLDTLRSRLAGCMVRRVRQEVLKQLPPRTDTRIPVAMTPEQLEVHDRLKQPIAALLKIARKRPLTQAEFLRLMLLLTTQRIVSNGLAQLEFDEYWPELQRMKRPTERSLQSLSSPKLTELRELLRGLVLEQGRKVVVFSQWRRMLKLACWAVKDLLAADGLQAVFFTGHEKQKRRTQNLVDFHDDPDTRILFASDAGGVGLNLQRAANCCINLEVPWNPAVLEQRIGRIYRIGQKHPIDVYNLVCEVGIESRIADLVDNKQAFFSGLFDGTSDTIDFKQSGSFLSRVQKIVEPIEVPALPEAAVDGADGGEDDAAEEREVEELLDAADESRDEASRMQEGEPDAAATREADSGTKEASGTADVGEERGVEAEQVADLFSQIEIRRKNDGRLLIEASPGAASALGALFEGMARLLREAARD